ncbi:hypothetical protein AAD001_05395 [Colwelliaceae bacterium 6471]
MKLKILILMSLTYCLTSSSFFLAEHLDDLIRNGLASEEQIAFAASKNVASAKLVLRKKHIIGSDNWLSLTQDLAVDDSLYALELGQYYYNVQTDELAFLWLQRAVEQGEQNAVFPLAKLWFQRQAYQQVLALSSSSPQDIELLLLAVEAAIAQGDIAFVSRHITRLNHEESAQELLTLITRYKILDTVFNDDRVLGAAQPLLPSAMSATVTPSVCHNSIQLFATNIHDLDYLQTLVERFSTHPLRSAFCFSPIRYVPLAQLKCQHDDKAAIQCDESIWQRKVTEINTRYLGVLVPKGGANVHFGIMYLDNNDTVNVIAHELSHLLGFVDEYPLSEHHTTCQQHQQAMFAPNVAIIKEIYYGDKTLVRAQVLKQIPWAKFIKSSTPILTPADKGANNSWQLGTPLKHKDEFGIFAAETCDGRKVQAFKPLLKPTQLTYFELDFPAQYQKIIADDLNAYSMPSFHYNVALSLFGQGRVTEAKGWLNVSAEFEKNKLRQMKVLQGAF